MIATINGYFLLLLMINDTIHFITYNVHFTTILLHSVHFTI